MPIIAVRRPMARKANTIVRYAAENGNAATIKRFKESHDIGDSTVQLFKKPYGLYTKRVVLSAWKPEIALLSNPHKIVYY